MFILQSLTILESDVDVCFSYSWVQRRFACCLCFSKDM